MSTTMYAAMVNSPVTTLSGAITNTDTTIPVTDVSKLPTAPNIATIGTDSNAETILYTGLSSNTLTGVTRGFQGTAQAWSSGANIARYFTAYDHNAFKSNIEGLLGIDVPPINPSAYDDEFTDTSLNAKWSWANQGGATANTNSVPGYLYIASDSNSGWRGIFQTVPTGSWTMTAKIHYGGDYINDCYCGLLTVPSTDGNIEALALGKDGNYDIKVRGEKWTDWGTFNTDKNARVWGVNSGYLKVDWNGTNLTYYVSINGIAWTKLCASFAPSFTPGRIGIGVRGSNNPSLIEWFRVVQ